MHVKRSTSRRRGMPHAARRGARAVVVAAVACAALFSAGARAGEGDVARRVLDELSEADRARSARAAAEAEWERERRGIEALAASIEEALSQVRARAVEDRAKLASVREELAALEEAAPPRGELERVITEAVRDAGGYLDDVGRGLLPGIVPEAGARAASSPLSRLQDLVLRMQQAEAATRAWDVGIFEGERDGGTVAVKVLRCGAVAAWWRGLAGSEAGTAVWRDGALHLTDAAGAARTAIVEAFSIFEGNRVPAVVALPFDHAREEE